MKTALARFVGLIFYAQVVALAEQLRYADHVLRRCTQQEEADMLEAEARQTALAGMGN